MKKLLILLFLACGLIVKAQIAFEQAYDSASAINTGTFLVSNKLTIVHFEVSGDHFVKINKVGKTIDIYDMNHAKVKTISFASFPIDNSGGYHGMGLYLSENLFDTDPGIEFMYTANAGFSGQFTNIYNEDGSVIFADSGAPYIIGNEPIQQAPIYNTTNGTKMILSYRYSHLAMVFGLPGTLTTAVQQSNESLMQVYSSMSVSNPYPNPTIGSTSIDYVLPPKVKEGEIVFFDMGGKEIRRFRVDHSFTSLLVSAAEIPAGTYLYHLRVNDDATAAKRMVVIK